MPGVGVGDEGHIPPEFFDFLVDFIKENNGKAKFKDIKDAIAKNADRLTYMPATAIHFRVEPELVIFAALAEGMITAELRDPSDLNSIEEKTIFTFVSLAKKA